MNKLIQPLALLLALSVSAILQAQQESNLLFNTNIWQANRLNPALQSGHQIVVGLPSLYSSFHSTGATLSDFVQTTAEGENIVTLSDAINELESNNLIWTQADLELFSLGMYLRRLPLQLTFSAAWKGNFYLNYPKSLAELLFEGNANAVGRSIPLGHQMQAMAYTEVALGASYQINDLVQVGARIKWLNGQGDLSTGNDDLALFTDSEVYALRLDADYQLNTSNFFTYNGLNDLGDIISTNTRNTDALFKASNGVAFDLGVTLNYEDWKISLSVLDIGSINWKEEVNNYTLDGRYEYDGLDVIQDFLDDSLSLDNTLDTLNAIFDVEETSDSYTTRLPTRFFYTLSKEVGEKWVVGGSLMGVLYFEQFYPAIGLHAQHNLNDKIALGASYVNYYNSFSHLGLNASVQLGFVQLYALTNNMLPLFQAAESNTFDFRVGVNLLFKKRRDTDEFEHVHRLGY